MGSRHNYTEEETGLLVEVLRDCRVNNKSISANELANITNEFNKARNTQLTPVMLGLKMYRLSQALNLGVVVKYHSSKPNKPKVHLPIGQVASLLNSLTIAIKELLVEHQEYKKELYKLREVRAAVENYQSHLKKNGA